MGKQYNKLIKRRRRTAYLARRKAAINAANPNSSKKVKSSAKKSSRKKAATAEKSEPVAEKAKAKDVLGPDAVAEGEAKDLQESPPAEESSE